MTLTGTTAELRRALRTLARSPGFTLASVVTLGMGLGAAAAIFTVVDAVLLRPLPYPEAGRVVRVAHTVDVMSGPTPLARFALPFFERESRSFEVLGGHWSPERYTLGGEVGAERVAGVRATAGLLDVVGARPAAGRLFTEADAALEDASGVVVSHRLWQRRYGGAAGVAGRTVQVDGVTRQILGVMAPGVDLPRQKVDLWIPYAVPEGIPADDAFRIHVLARLREGVERSEAAAELGRLTARFPEIGAFYATILEQFGLRTIVRPVREEVVGEVERPLWIILGAVAILLLVAAANVATLFLVRAEARRRETTVRRALGAGRLRLLGHFLAESACIAAAAGAVGLGLAAAGVGLFRRLAPPAIPRLDEIAVGGPTAALVAVLAVGVTAILGFYPFLRFGRSARAVPTARRVGEGRRQATLGGGLVVVQVALALVLMAGSALMFQTFRQLRAVDPGFDAGGVLVSELALPEPFYPSASDVRGFRERLLERVRGLPQVQGAAIGPSPLGDPTCNGLYVEGREVPDGQFPPCVPIVLAGPGYFELLGIRLQAGRAFTGADLAGTPVAMVTANVARRLWPDEDPLAAAVHPSPRRGPPWFPIVGVVEPVRGLGPDRPATEALYLPLAALEDEGLTLRTMTLLVATAPGEELAPVPALRRTVAELDPGVPLTVHGALEDELAGTMVRSTFTLFLLGTAAAVTLLLGLVGLYGVVAHRVESRRAEIGVRMAIGASAPQVRKLVLAHSLRLVLAGTVIGLVAAVFLTRFLASLLYEVRPGDPVMLGAAALALATVASAATWLPAQRATSVDPAATLRSD